MKTQPIILFIFIIYCYFVNAENLVALQVDSTSVSVKTFQYDGVDGSSIFPGKSIVKIAGAQPFRVSAYEESFIVSAIKGWDYYVILANGQDTLLYAIDLQTGEIFINGYSPNKQLLYIYGLTYDLKSDQLVAISSMEYDAGEPYFDVVLVDPNSGEISQNLTIQNSYPNNTWYSGIYTSSQSQSQLYILFQSIDEKTNNTISGFTTISTIDGSFVNNVWINSQNNFVYSFVYDETSSMILATMSQYNGKSLDFISINPTNGDYTVISSDQVCAGSGPVVIDGVFLSPGKEPKPSHSLSLVDTNSGKIIKEYFDLFVDISYLSSF
ncbi:hypothetical protein RB653_003338 [Dictyostelium firmibasis]|uniref:Uncharacterized protein n=1 Tax=Dictyostelium firmibasis TaxID=79012 RepID=A0AAN7U8Y4_9MYCE